MGLSASTLFFALLEPALHHISLFPHTSLPRGHAMITSGAYLGHRQRWEACVFGAPTESCIMMLWSEHKSAASM